MEKKVAFLGIYITLALIFSYIETLIPIQFGIPGIKLGLANIIIVLALYKISIKETIIIAVIRIVLAGFIFGNMFSIIYSLSGCIASLSIMYLLKKQGSFGILGVSIAGAVFHNLGQFLMAMLVVQNFNISYYIPILLLGGIVTGLLIGILSKELLRRFTNIKVL